MSFNVSETETETSRFIHKMVSKGHIYFPATISSSVLINVIGRRLERTVKWTAIWRRYRRCKGCRKPSTITIKTRVLGIELPLDYFVQEATQLYGIIRSRSETL